MTFSKLTEQYYDWLYKIVCGEWEPRNLSFHRLLMFLYNRRFIPTCEMDVCRATAVVELEDEDTHCRPEALVVTPEQTGQLTESQTEMALLLQGKSWTDTGEHRFALEAGPLRLRRAFCGVEQEGESFLLRVNALSRNALPADAEAELEALCADTVHRCWTLGLDISGLGAHQALRDGHFALTTKNVCPEIRADVKLMKC